MNITAASISRGLSMNTNRFQRLACAMGLLLACSSVVAANPSDLIAALSEAKARAEGRARLLQSCSPKGSTVPASLLAKYEDARATFNSRIDALTVDIRSKRLKDFDAGAELPRLNEALNRVDQFIVVADELLSKRKCAVLKKASWATIVPLLLNPEVLKVVIDFFQKAGVDADRKLTS